MRWNLTSLAECLLQLGEPQQAFEEQLMGFEGLFRGHYLARMRAKLGLLNEEDGDPALITEWLHYLQDNGLDFTLSFRRLADGMTAADDGHSFGEVGKCWRERVERQPQTAQQLAAHMNAINPLVIPRNHQVERVIQAAIEGDLLPFEQLQPALQPPYELLPGLEDFAEPRPWQKMPRLRAKATMSWTVRKYGSYCSSRISASSCATRAVTRAARRPASAVRGPPA